MCAIRFPAPFHGGSFPSEAKDAENTKRIVPLVHNPSVPENGCTKERVPIRIFRFLNENPYMYPLP